VIQQRGATLRTLDGLSELMRSRAAARDHSSRRCGPTIAPAHRRRSAGRRSRHLS
jgi:hypothetical protein